MSLITRCPACGTMFKVVPDQLRISEGWVRCGHCSDVFDASAHLMPDGAGPVQQSPAGPESRPDEQLIATAGLRNSAIPSPAVNLEPADSAVEPTDDFESSIHTGIGDDVASEDVAAAELEAEARALKETPLDAPFVLLREDPAVGNDRNDESNGIDASGTVAKTRRQTSPERDSELESGLESEFEADEPSFMRHARRRALWRRVPMRPAMAAASAGLAVLLALQVSVHERDRIAAMNPALIPLLKGLCQPFGCELSPLRQIDAIAIETSSFNRLPADAFRLQVTLRNQGVLDVAMPALELTLTDGQDQPVVRKVLSPSELQHPGVLAGASEWTGSYALAVAANGATSRIAGYRLLAFYP